LPKRANRVIGFDVETVVRTKGDIAVCEPITFQFYSEDFNPPVIKFLKVEEFNRGRSVFNSKTRSCVFAAFNAEFDFAALCKVLDFKHYNVNVVYNKGRFIKAVLQHNKNQWEIVDLWNIFPTFNVERLGKMLGLPKLEKPKFLGVSEPSSRDEWEQLKAYGLRDAEICYKAAKWVQSFFGGLGVTLPATVMFYYRKKYNPHWIFQCEENSQYEPFIRQAYKGGRVECWVRGTPNKKVYIYDVVSLYPYVMSRYRFPTGNLPFKRKSSLNLCREGVADVTVKQDADIPVLCTRVKTVDGFTKLVFPNGVFRDWFTFAELRYAEIVGAAKILKVHDVIEANDTFKYFNDYVMEFWQRKETDVDGREFWKLCLNALYGKFGFTGEGSVYHVTSNGLEKLENSVNGKKVMFPRNVLLAAYISAYGRLYMHKLYRMAGAENIVYTDTDSIHSFKPIDFESNSLGGLKFKGEGYGTYVRSKFYIFNDEVKCRGLPKMVTANDVKNMIQRGTVKAFIPKIQRLRSSYRLGIPPLSNVIMEMNFSLEEDGKRVYRKKLIGEQLLNEWSDSEPLIMEA